MLTTEEQDAILKSARALARRHLEVKRRKLLAMGLWPKALPLQNFSTGDDFELTRKNRT